MIIWCPVQGDCVSTAGTMTSAAMCAQWPKRALRDHRFQVAECLVVAPTIS
jgi:hypothetical protein